MANPNPITSGSTVYPSENQIETTLFDGSRFQETNHTEYAEEWVAGYISSGLTVPETHGDLDVPVAAGVAMIDGHRIEVDGSNDITVAPSTTNYIFLQVTFDGSGNVDVVQLVANTTDTPPANSVRLAQVVTDATTVTAGADRRNVDPYLDDSITGKSLNIDHGHDDGTVVFGTSDTVITTITIPKGDLKGRSPDILVLFACTIDMVMPAVVASMAAEFNVKLNGVAQKTLTQEIDNLVASALDEQHIISFHDRQAALDETIANTIVVTGKRTGGTSITVIGNAEMDLIEINA